MMSQNLLEELFQKKPYLQLYYKLEKKESDYKLLQNEINSEYYIKYQNRPLASTVSPKKAAERLLSGISISDSNVTVVMGFGNPHILELVNKGIKPEGLVLYIDTSVNAFLELRDSFFKDILLVPGRHIFCGENSLSILWNYIDSLPLGRFSGLKFIKNPGSISLEPDFYSFVEENLKKLFSARISDLLTKFEFEKIWVKNSLYNTIEFFKPNSQKYKIMELENRFPNLPALLVSAGPSLRQFCPLIQKIRDKVFVMSCDTSLKVLLKFGIIPDAVMTLDAQTHSYFHFMGIQIKEYPLFTDLVGSPKLLREQSNASIVFTTTAKYTRDYTGQNTKEMTAGAAEAIEQIGEIGELQSGGSVATSAFDALRYMGFSPIVLVGQDLAYTGKEIHSTGTHHNEKWLTQVNRKRSLEKINESIIRKRKTKYVPSVDNSLVITDHVLEIYRIWFERSIQNLDLKVYNIADKGSLISGVINLNTSACLKLFENTSNHNYPWKQLKPWKVREDTKKNQQQKYELPEFVLSLLAELEKESFDLQNIEKASLSDKEIVNILKEKINMIPFIKPILRKEEVYLARHQNELSDAKQKEILILSLLKEIKNLKRNILVACREYIEII
ncbi:MAG: motility associated factor glycosyltransferase family protein [Leptospiraceae bacterium]|nr:motility associated factor glycosyltransferase family protein [Leptospiraceae bacterium]MCP5497423.1 motility associated factor glycosyltransferase family protein [Leptospiraceae bacterium]